MNYNNGEVLVNKDDSTTVTVIGLDPTNPNYFYGLSSTDRIGYYLCSNYTHKQEEQHESY